MARRPPPRVGESGKRRERAAQVNAPCAQVDGVGPRVDASRTAVTEAGLRLRRQESWALKGDALAEASLVAVKCAAEFEAAKGALDGGLPGGPAPFDLQKKEFQGFAALKRLSARPALAAKVCKGLSKGLRWAASGGALYASSSSFLIQVHLSCFPVGFVSGRKPKTRCGIFSGGAW